MNTAILSNWSLATITSKAMEIKYVLTFIFYAENREKKRKKEKKKKKREYGPCVVDLVKFNNKLPYSTSRWFVTFSGI